MSQIANRLITGSSLRTLTFLSNVAVAFFMMPFLVHTLGDHWYGFWAFIASLVGYYGYLDLGLATAVNRYVSKYIGAEDHHQMNQVINTSLAIYSALSLVALMITGLVILLSPIFLKDSFNLTTFRVCIFIMGLSFAIGLPLRSFSGVLSSHFRYDLIAYKALIRLAIRTALIVYFLSQGKGIIALALIAFVMDIFSYGALIWLVRKFCPEVAIARRYYDKTKIKELFKYSSASFLAQLGDVLRFKLDVIIISFFLGAVAITHYSIAANLVTYFKQFMVNLVSLMGPVFSRYEGRGDYEAIRSKFLFTTKISVFWAFLLGGLFLTCARPFIIRWMGGSYTDSVLIVYILITSLVVALMQTPSVNVLYGISKHYYFAITNVIEGVANLILSLLLVNRYGIVGVALGTAIPLFIIKIFVQPVYVCRVIGIPTPSYYMHVLRCSILGVLIMLAGFKFLQPLLVPNYPSLLLYCAIVSVSYATVQFAFIFSRQEKGYFIDYARRFLPKKKAAL